jgi:oxalate decarboxylase/phosphoglucose isomerase-like protein (cupin superfamily)
VTGSDRPTDPEIIDPSRPALRRLPDDSFKSAAGVIDNLRHGGLPGTVSVLYCVAGSVRANHYHKEDEHWLYVVDGEVEYYERAIGETELPPVQRFYEREMFYTPPMREHAMRFPEGAVLVSMSSRSRTHEEHEADVVRLERPMVT